ncbi:MAG TPA: ABC transporter substrate-binding protein [Candidatus Polarisedimenticolaceae bacterium]|nr:ABC transporter substrate-binding protein [Candidatus Polarisedimenticolaceae bacterium]
MSNVWPRRRAAAALLLSVVPACAGRIAPTPPAAEPPARGGTFRLVQEVPETLDPLLAGSVYDSLPVNQIFDGLVALDASLNIVPALAESWTISRDGTSYSFHLREGVRFHDGTPLEAEDVAFTLRRLLDPRHAKHSLAFAYLTVVEGAKEFAAGHRADLAGVEVLDPRTLRIRLERPYTSFLEVLSMDGVSVVPRARVERLGEARFAREPVGTGPFRLAGWTSSGLRLEANPDYFRGRPYLDALEISFLGPDERDGEARFARGQIDLLELSRETLAHLARNPGVRVYRSSELGLGFLGLNTRMPPLDQAWLRQAITHAIDRQAIAADAPQTRREATGILPPGMFGYSPDLKGLEYDPGRSRALLAEAGHPGGNGLAPLDLYNPSRSAASLRLLEQVRSDLSAVGIRLELHNISWTEMNQRLDRGSAPAFLLAWIADLSDPDSFLRSLFQADGSGNYFAYRDPGTDALLETGAGLTNPVERARFYRALERRILDEAPLVPLYHSIGLLATRDRVHGLQAGPLGVAKVDFEKVWLQ